MKKIFLTVLTIGFLAIAMTSCQSEAKKDSADSTAVAQLNSTKMADSLSTVSVIEPTKEEIARAEVKAPEFSNEEVNNGLKEFNDLKTEFQNSLASKDTEATKKVIDRYNVWVVKTAVYGNKLQADENQKFIEYYEKLAAQWNIVARQAKLK